MGTGSGPKLVTSCRPEVAENQQTTKLVGSKYVNGVTYSSLSEQVLIQVPRV